MWDGELSKGKPAFTALGSRMIWAEEEEYGAARETHGRSQKTRWTDPPSATGF